MDNSAWIIAGAAPLTALLWGAVSMFMSEKTRESAKQTFSEQIKAELAIFKVSLLRDLNGTYKRSGECVLIEDGNIHRMEVAEKKIDELYQYAHDNKHSQANILHEILGEIHFLKETKK